MKKKKIYVNKIEKKVGNNQKSCEVEEFVEKTDNNEIVNDVEDKLHKLFNTNGYIFNIDVKIITNAKTYQTKIASQVGNNLVTLDNDVICIDEIKDIIF